MSTATAENRWVNTRDGQNPEILTKARQIIEGCLYATLSTCSADGMPWASPVLFTYDTAWQLYWSSAIAAQHSQNIYQNQGRVAVAIYTTHLPEGKGQGIYLSGTAGELEPDQVAAVMARLFQRAGGSPPQRTAADYLNNSPRRFYRFRPEIAWINGERLALGNQLVDTKIQLSLPDLIAGSSTSSGLHSLG